MRPMILFNQVNKWYGEYQALTDVSAEIKSGEVVVVCGPSGSGKSTLIRTVNRLEPIEKGQILFDGVDIHGSSTRLNQLRTRIGFVFQSFNLFPHVSVLENIMMSPVKVLGEKRSEARRHAGELLERVGLSHKADVYPAQLSGDHEDARRRFIDGFELPEAKDIADCVAFALAAPVAVNIGNIEITPTLQVPGGLSTMRPGDRES